MRAFGFFLLSYCALTSSLPSVSSQTARVAGVERSEPPDVAITGDSQSLDPSHSNLTFKLTHYHESDRQFKIITLGDSITKGVRTGVTAEQTFSALLESALKKKNLNVEVVNVGIGGERTDQALKRLSKSVIDRKPDFVTIMYGTNDSYVDRGKQESRLSLEEYRANLEELVRRLRNENIVPVLMTEPRWGEKARKNGVGEHPNLRLERYVDACRKVAKEMRVPLVDNYRVWSEQAKEIDIGTWTTDQCHPNPQGHKIIAETMLPVMLRVLKQKKSQVR